MNRTATLDLAKNAVAARPNQYGAPEDNFVRIARRWNAHFSNTCDSCNADDITFDAADVAIMLADVKLARLESDPTHLDSWVDVAGYAACGSEVSGAGDAVIDNDDQPPSQIMTRMESNFAKLFGDEPPMTEAEANAAFGKPGAALRVAVGSILPLERREGETFEQAARRVYNQALTGFVIDETVNLKISRFGQGKGKVVGFDDGKVIVAWPSLNDSPWASPDAHTTGRHDPDLLRHGP